MRSRPLQLPDDGVADLLDHDETVPTLIDERVGERPHYMGL
jgi:hypothetical protein